MIAYDEAIHNPNFYSEWTYSKLSRTSLSNCICILSQNLNLKHNPALLYPKMIKLRKNLSSFFRGNIKYSSKVANEASDDLKPFDSIPGPMPLPLIGNIWRYLPLIGEYDVNDLAANAKLLRKKYGKVVREKIHDKLTILHLYDPTDVEVLFRHDKTPSRRAFLGMKKYRLDRPDSYTNGGIIPENGQEWLKNRAMFQERMLSKSKVSGYTEKIDIETLKTIDEILGIFKHDDNRTDEIQIQSFQNIFTRWSLRCITSLFLNCQLETIESKELERLIQELDNTLLGTHGTDTFSTKWMTKPDKCKYYQMLVKSQDFLYQFSDKQLEKVINEGDTKRGSMVHDWLFEDKISRKDVNSFVMDAFLGGVHSTSYTLAHLMYHLARNPDSQNMIYDEIVKFKLNEKNLLDASDIDKLASIQYCIQETLRINPISTGTGRVTPHDMKIAGYKIPKGVMVIVQNEVTSHDGSIFSEPHKFKPLRWKHYRSCPRHEKPSPFASIPFGLGSRSCIGRRVIELEMKILICRLMLEFQIIDVSEPRRKTMTVHKLDGDVNVRLRKRKNSNNT